MSYILIIDDELDICELTADILEENGFQASYALDSDKAFELMQDTLPNLIVLDIWLKGSALDGLGILEIVKVRYPHIPVLVISGHGNIDTATKALKLGAYDYIEKPFSSEKIVNSIENVLKLSAIDETNEQGIAVSSVLNNKSYLFTGESTIAGNLKKSAKELAKNDSRIFITEPLGSRAIDFAEYIHNNSKRAESKFITLNASRYKNISEFKEVLYQSKGRVEQAENGTLFIYNINKSDSNIIKEIERLATTSKYKASGSKDESQIDIRIIASGKQDIESSVFSKNIKLQLLSERPEDIEPICKEISAYISNELSLSEITFSENVINILKTRKLKANFDELENLVRFLNICYEGKKIKQNMLPEGFGVSSETEGEALSTLSLNLKDARDEFEKNYLRIQLKRFNNNITECAKFVGMNRSALHKKLKSLGL